MNHPATRGVEAKAGDVEVHAAVARGEDASQRWQERLGDEVRGRRHSVVRPAADRETVPLDAFGRHAKRAMGRTVCSTSTALPALPMSMSKTPGPVRRTPTWAAAAAAAESISSSVDEPPSNARDKVVLPMAAPVSRAPLSCAAASAHVRCCRCRPGTGRPARMLVMARERLKTHASASDVRSVCPPPSPAPPSISIITVPLLPSVVVVFPGAAFRTLHPKRVQQLLLGDGVRISLLRLALLNKLATQSNGGRENEDVMRSERGNWKLEKNTGSEQPSPKCEALLNLGTTSVTRIVSCSSSAASKGIAPHEVSGG